MSSSPKLFPVVVAVRLGNCNIARVLSLTLLFVCGTLRAETYEADIAILVEKQK